MNRTLSVYLDLVRFSSAMLIFVVHGSKVKFHGAFLEPVTAYGRDAVIALFVLSGFVIAYIASSKDNTIGKYMVSRLARLYSVVIPALILTVGTSAIGMQFDTTVYAGGDYQGSDPLLRIIVTLLFSNELWFWSIQPFSNSPFWSISYEFWYYMIFAAAFFPRGNAKIWCTALVALIAGPKILLLFPPWLLGLLLYLYRVHLPKGMTSGLLLFFLPVVAYLAYRHVGGEHIVFNFVSIPDDVLLSFKYSIKFLNAYIVGLLVTIHFAGALVLSQYFKFAKMPAAIIQYLAGITFSLYLFHYPLLMMWAAIFDNGILVVTLVLLTIAALAPLTEGRKKDWKRLFEALRIRLKLE